MKRWLKKPYFNESLKRVYRLLTLYFSDNPDFETEGYEANGYRIPYDLKKGILLLGKYGVGKSFAMEKVFRTFANYTNNKNYRVIRCQDLIADFQNHGIEALQKYEQISFYKDRLQHIYLDEIGAQPHEINFFGTKYKPIEQFLFNRNNLFVDSGILTHASSNLKLSDFLSLYDERIYSRLFEMFNIIILDSDVDLRFNGQKIK